MTINGAGPYRFILDTGANTSALAPRVAEELRLQGAGDTQIQVHGVTGSALLQAVRVESLRAGDVKLPPMNLPVLPGPVLGGADGILGINGLQSTRIEVDFERDRVVIIPSTGRRALQGFLVVPARLRKGGLLLVKGKVGKVPVQVIIDTGAEHTLGNMALRTALLERARYDDEIDVTVLGATTDVSPAPTSVRRGSRSARWTSWTCRSPSATCTSSRSGGSPRRLRWSSAWTCWGCSGSSSSTTNAASSSSSLTTCQGS